MESSRLACSSFSISWRKYHYRSFCTSQMRSRRFGPKRLVHIHKKNNKGSIALFPKLVDIFTLNAFTKWTTINLEWKKLNWIQNLQIRCKFFPSKKERNTFTECITCKKPGLLVKSTHSTLVKIWPERNKCDFV